jgi:hypothetical protein
MIKVCDSCRREYEAEHRRRRFCSVGCFAASRRHDVPSSYRLAHKHVVRAKGDTRDHACADCGRPAREWSYDGQDPDEKTDQGGRAYSTHPEHYLPRCAPCHKVHDANLRPVTGSQNQAKQAPRNGGTSQYKGVSWRPSKGRWVASIGLGHRSRYLGSYTHEGDAARAYDRAALAQWGAHARLNFPQDNPFCRWDGGGDHEASPDVPAPAASR